MRLWFATFAVLLFTPTALAQPVAVGSRPPALAVAEWVSGAPSKSADLTVVMFVGTWCPVTREVFDLLDPAAEQLDMQIVAITPEDETDVQEFLRIGGWSSVVLGRDPDRQVRAAWFGDDKRNYFMPYAFVVAGRGKGHVLWHGRVAQSDHRSPLAHFEAILAAVADGTRTVDAAVVEAAQHELASEALRKLQQGSTVEWYDAQLEVLAGLEIPRTLHRDAANRFNQIAWTLATEDPDETRLDVAVRAVEAAFTCGGASDPAIMDTYARVLWECARRDEALEVQQTAMDLAAGTHWESQLLPALCSYAAELGVPPPDACTPGPWTGNINQAFERYAGDRCVVVAPDPGLGDELDAAWRDEMLELGARFFKGAPIQSPEGTTEEQRASKLLVLYGRPERNALTRAVLDHHGITLSPTSVAVGETTIEVANPFLIAALPSPWQPELPVLVYTALQEDHSHGLNSVFHGPTALVFGSASGGDDAHTIQTEPRLDDGVVVGLDVLPAELSREQAVADLWALHDGIRDRYAGYDDIRWKARARGTEVEDDLQQLLDQIATRETWTGPAYFDLVMAYLEPVQDTHFHLAVTAIEGGGIVAFHERLVSSTAPYFVDGHVVGADADLPVIPPPHRAQLGVPYRFPTLPRDGIDPAFLVGVLGDPEAPPAELTLDGGDGPKAFPVHRGRALTEGRDRGWGVTEPPDAPLPVLTVTTMREASLRDLGASADSLRQQPAVVLDLRGNGGGSDSPARQWCSRFSHQWFRWGCHAQVVPGEAAPLRHWYSGSDHAYILHGGDAAEVPYDGQLFVLTDTGVASSGETFTMLASQIEGAVLVGENTSGCMDYGNADQHLKLPHSRIDLWFGRSRFVWQCVRPAAEGVGVFPDYWLDEEDPVQWLSEHAVEPTSP